MEPSLRFNHKLAVRPHASHAHPLDCYVERVRGIQGKKGRDNMKTNIDILKGESCEKASFNLGQSIRRGYLLAIVELHQTFGKASQVKTQHIYMVSPQDSKEKEKKV